MGGKGSKRSVYRMSAPDGHWRRAAPTAAAAIPPPSRNSGQRPGRADAAQAASARSIGCAGRMPNVERQVEADRMRERNWGRLGREPPRLLWGRDDQYHEKTCGCECVVDGRLSH